MSRASGGARRRAWVLSALAVPVLSVLHLACSSGGGGGDDGGSPPLAPTGLTVQGVTSTSVVLVWSDASGDESGFQIERSSVSAATGFAQVGTAAAGATGWTDAGLAPATTYWYRVRAWNAHGGSPYSNSVIAITEALTTAPPVGLTAVAQGATEIALAWSPGGVGQTGFRLERSATSAAAGFQEIASLPGSTTAHLDSGLAAGSQYWYRLRAAYPHGMSGYSGVATATTGDGVLLPPDPATVATPIDPGVATDFHAAVAFLFSGPDPIQTGVGPGTIEPERAAVLRGRVLEADGLPAPGAVVSVQGHPELGQTLSRADGRFDLVVNGGWTLAVGFSKAGRLPALRQVEVPWRAFVPVPDVALVRLDPVSTVVDLGSSTPIQVARGSVVTDDAGTRQATLLVPAGSAATLVLPGGATVEADSLTIRATEYTVGERGPDAMPSQLPPSSGYTYAVELSADEALAAGAVDVRFDRPLPFYVEDFLGFPVGSAVPAGYLDRERGIWVASENGRVIRLLAVTGGRADVDADGDGLADAPAALAALGLTETERERLAVLYPSPPVQLWRVPVSHFTPWDCNWAYGPPDDAEPPEQPRPRGEDKDDEFTIECASIVEAQNQILGEALPIPGTPYALHYRSDRAPGRTAQRTVEIRLTDDRVPAGVQWIGLSIHVAGRDFGWTYAPAPGLAHTFTWDGLDAYGRAPQGPQRAEIVISYAYPAVYYPVRADFDAAFARYADQLISPVRARQAVTLDQRYSVTLRAGGRYAQAIAGWSLDVHHAVDPDGGLLLGDGGRRSPETLGNALNVVTTVAGVGECWEPSPDGTPATQTCLSSPRGIGFGPDGKDYYIADTGRCVIRLVEDGLTSIEAGQEDYCTYTGDGVPGWETALSYPTGGAPSAEGGYIVDTQNHRVRAVDRDGIIRTVAGDGSRWFGGDGGPAEAAQLDTPRAAALAPDGSLFVSDTGNNRIRRISPDGLIETVAGNGSGAYCGDGGPGRSACLDEPSGLAVGPDGSVYVADTMNHRIRRLRPDGIIETAVGDGTAGFAGDGGPATAARLAWPLAVAVSRDGSLYVADTENQRIRVVRPDGIIRTLAGSDAPGFLDGVPARHATFSTPTALALAGDGSLHVADTGNHRIRRIASALGDGYLAGAVYSADGTERYVFDEGGRHVRTLATATGALRQELLYDAAGRLAGVMDGYGTVTTVERDGEGNPTAIVAPDGQRTELEVNAEGYLARISRPRGETTRFGYAPGGLLASVTDPAGGVRSFSYDAAGRLVRDEGPSGHFLALARGEREDGFEVQTATGAGPLARFTVALPAEGGSVRTDAAADGRVQVTSVSAEGTRTITRPDGTTVTLTFGPDPRYGVQAPLVTEQVIRTPGGLVNTYRREVSVTPAPAWDPVGYTALHSVRTINGRAYVLDEDAVARQAIATSPAGRTVAIDYDGQGRVVRRQRGDLAPTTYGYDFRGRVAGVTHGEWYETRWHGMSYGADGFLESLTYPDGSSVRYAHDASGRVVGQVFPDGREAKFAWDPRGKLLSYAPPGRLAQELDFGADGLLAGYAWPDAGQGVDTLALERGPDGLVTRRVLPDGTAVELSYDAGRRLVGKRAGADEVAFAYHPTTGLLSSVARTGAGVLSLAHDGFLRTRAGWQGPVTGGVTRSFDDDFRVTAETVDGTPPVSFEYDADGLLTRAGELAVSRSAANGLPTSAAIGAVAETWGYDAFGEPVERRVSFQGSELYVASFVWDPLGRVAQRSEAVLGGPAEVEALAYDAAGRLHEVTRDGSVVASYLHDENGNRLGVTGPSGDVAATYDARDRMTTYGPASFLWGRNGELAGRSEGGVLTSYAYDAFGALTAVSRAGAPLVEYVVDGVGLRIGRRVDGVLVQGFVHDGGRRVIAELDGAGNVVSRFVRGPGRGAPDYMVRGGRTYRIVSDHVGSPRLVVDVQDGTVAQRLEYGPFGEVLADTQPGFQPFGFAGGLLDPDTGLTHLDARDYDAGTGRFLTPDPMGPASGAPNAYVYAFGDPVNWVDRSGRLNESWNGPADYMDEVPPGTVEPWTDPETGDYGEVGTTEDGVDFDRSCYSGTCTETIWDEQSQTSGETQYSSDCEGGGCGDTKERNRRAEEQMQDVDPGVPGPNPPPPPPAPPSPPSPGKPGGSSPGGGASGGGSCSVNIWRDSNGNVVAVVPVPQ